MKRFTKISTLVLALCSLFSFTSNNHDVRSVKAAKGAGDENWSLIGSFTDYSNPTIPVNSNEPITYDKVTWTKDLKFQYNPEASQYELAYTFDEGDQFKIRKDGSYDVQIGYCGNTGGGIGDYLTNEGTYKNENGIGVEYANFKVKTAGTYLLKVADDNVANYGDKSYGFSIEKITTATLIEKKLSSVFQGDLYFEQVKNIVFTTDPSKRKGNLFKSFEVGHSADQLTDDGKKIGMYLYTNETDSTMYDAVVYANVDRIFASPNSYSMLEYWTSLETITFESFDTSRTVDMSYMFKGCEVLTTINTSAGENVLPFYTTNVIDMAQMFRNCHALKKLDVTRFDTSNVTNMSQLFCGCSSLEAIDVTNFDTSKVEKMDEMFNECALLTEIDVSNFDTSNADMLSSMFLGCKSLKSIDVSSFNTSKVVQMEGLFYGCESLKEIDLSNFDTSNVELMFGLFWGCTNLEKVDISSFDLSSVNPKLENYFEEPVSGAFFMFKDAPNVKEIKTPAVLAEGVTIELPAQYTQVEGGVQVIDNTALNMRLVPGSLELNQLLNDMYYLNTCENYDQASALRERYNALSDSDKEVFKTVTDKDNVLMSAKLDYMEYMLTLNSEAEKNNIHIMTTINDSPSFLVVTTIISSLAILGYYMIQKRKSSID